MKVTSRQILSGRVCWTGISGRCSPGAVHSRADHWRSLTYSRWFLQRWSSSSLAFFLTEPGSPLDTNRVTLSYGSFRSRNGRARGLTYSYHGFCVFVLAWCYSFVLVSNSFWIRRKANKQDILVESKYLQLWREYAEYLNGVNYLNACALVCEVVSSYDNSKESPLCFVESWHPKWNFCDTTAPSCYQQRPGWPRQRLSWFGLFKQIFFSG